MDTHTGERMRIEKKDVDMAEEMVDELAEICDGKPGPVCLAALLCALDNVIDQAPSKIRDGLAEATISTLQKLREVSR